MTSLNAGATPEGVGAKSGCGGATRRDIGATSGDCGTTEGDARAPSADSGQNPAAQTHCPWKGPERMKKTPSLPEMVESLQRTVAFHKDRASERVLFWSPNNLRESGAASQKADFPHRLRAPWSGEARPGGHTGRPRPASGKEMSCASFTRSSLSCSGSGPRSCRLPMLTRDAG